MCPQYIVCFLTPYFDASRLSRLGKSNIFFREVADTQFVSYRCSIKIHKDFGGKHIFLSNKGTQLAIRFYNQQALYLGKYSAFQPCGHFWSFFGLLVFSFFGLLDLAQLTSPCNNSQTIVCFCPNKEKFQSVFSIDKPKSKNVKLKQDCLGSYHIVVFKVQIPRQIKIHGY